jgi:molybdenum cofactor biosynthesis enzyme
LATVRRFNARLSAKGYVWFWPKIAAALTAKHHWLIIACDSCGTVVDLDLRVKPRDPEASVRVALRDASAHLALSSAHLNVGTGIGLKP